LLIDDKQWFKLGVVMTSHLTLFSLYFSVILVVKDEF